jgi:hypothetical protein
MAVKYLVLKLLDYLTLTFKLMERRFCVTVFTFKECEPIHVALQNRMSRVMKRVLRKA